MEYIPLLSLIVAALSLFYSKRKDDKTRKRQKAAQITADHEQLLKLDLKLDQILNTTQESKNDVKELRRQFSEQQAKLIKHEEQIKTLFKMIGSEN